MSQDDDDSSYFDYFSGYVPSGEVFLMAANDIAQIARGESEEHHYCLHSLCLIGLVSYFEAFTKDHLASCISLAPHLIEHLEKAGYPTEIPAEEAYEFRESLQYRIGFLLTERFDLGSAKKINSVFTKVLQITPFSKKDITAYDRLLRDRNLLVHHGGTYTTSYIRQAFEEIPSERRRAHADSLETEAKRISDEVVFLKAVAYSLVNSCSDRLEVLLKEKGGTVPEQVSKALFAMKWWDEEGP